MHCMGPGKTCRHSLVHGVSHNRAFRSCSVTGALHCTSPCLQWFPVAFVRDIPDKAPYGFRLLDQPM